MLRWTRRWRRPWVRLAARCGNVTHLNAEAQFRVEKRKKMDWRKPAGADMKLSSRWHQQLTLSLSLSLLAFTSATQWVNCATICLRRWSIFKGGGLIGQCSVSVMTVDHHLCCRENDRWLLGLVGKAASKWKCKPAGDRNGWNFSVCSHQLLMVLPAADPAHQQRVVHGKLNDRVQFLCPLVQQVVQLWDKQAGGGQTMVCAVFFHCSWVKTFVKFNIKTWWYDENSASVWITTQTVSCILFFLSFKAQSKVFYHTTSIWKWQCAQKVSWKRS